MTDRMANRLPVGPGSRGGTFHLDPAAYYRGWRRQHPEYRARETRRSARRKHQAVDAVPMPTFTEALLGILRSEVDRTSCRAVARALCVEHSSIIRLLAGENSMHGTTVDAIVETYGLDTVIVEMRRLRREARQARSRSKGGTGA